VVSEKELVLSRFLVMEGTVCWDMNFVADRTDGRTYATVLCPSVCNVCIMAKRYVLPKNSEANRKWPMVNRTFGHATDDVMQQSMTPRCLEPNISKPAGDAIQKQSLITR